MQSKITMIGMYNFDNSLFDSLVLPSGIDFDTVKNEILMRSGEFEVLYPDPTFLKMAIGHWGKKHFRTFEKWIEALNIKYDPLNNYDRKEEYTDARSNSSNSESAENAISSGSSVGNTNGSSSPAQTTNTKTNTVSAFDSATYQPKEQTTDALTLQVAGSDSSDTASNTLSNDLKTSKHSGHDNEVVKHDAHLFGNIGVTTSQQMLQAELDIQRFNLAEQIADIFVSEFCIMIY